MGHRPFGAGDLDRADGAEHVADEAGHRGGGLALATAPGAQLVAELAAQQQGQEDGHDDDERHPRVDRRHDDHCGDGRHDGAGHVEPDVEHHREVHGVVAEAADGLA